MVEPREPRPITITQVVVVFALGVIVFFIIAFASKAVTSYRLRIWRDDLQAEIGNMETERQNLLLEIERRQSSAWIDQALLETGQVAPDVLAVRLEAAEGTLAAVEAEPEPPPRQTLTERVQGLSLFDNPNWRAWMQVLFEQE